MDKSLRIGVHNSEPGIGFQNVATDQWSGLDIDVARYIMHWLGIPYSTSSSDSDSSDTHLYQIDTVDRDSALLNGNVDLIIASYSITDGRVKKGISFTIPYLQTFQGILVRSHDAGKIKTLDDLRGQKVCAGPSNSTPYQHLDYLNKAQNLDITISKNAAGPEQCVTDLTDGAVNAVVYDDTILLGYQRQDPELALVDNKIWPRPEQYGVGFISKTPADAEDLNAAIRSMVRDGSWEKAIIENFCPTDVRCRQADILLASPPPTG
jgi:glutamate transport system substrate-binding protein